MDANERNKKLAALALTMPSWDDFAIRQYREDPELAQMRVISEFEEYLETGDITYLLSTLHKVAEAKGWSELSRETGISRPTLYSALSGKSDPRISIVMKILKALGVKVYTNISTARESLENSAPQIPATTEEPALALENRG